MPAPPEAWLRRQVHLRAAIEVARAAGAPLLVIKGLSLPSERPVLDADVVPIGSFFGALRAVVRHLGPNVEHASYASATVRWNGGIVDIQRWVWPPPCPYWVVQEIVSQAEPLPSCPLLLRPSPTDASVIAIMHFVKDGLGRVGHGGLAGDLSCLDPSGVLHHDIAARLTLFRLRRAGTMAFVALGENGRRHLDALAPTNAELSTALPRFDWGFGTTFNTEVFATAAVRDTVTDRAQAWGWAGLRFARRLLRHVARP